MDVMHVAPFLIMGIALGMDVFSVSLGLGMNGIPLRKMIWVGIVFGLFHMVMPFFGMVFGNMLSQEIHMLADVIGGLILVGIGAHMFFSAMIPEKFTTVPSMGIGLLFLALTVSIDSFSVGISFGIVGMNVIWLILYIGCLSSCLAWIGMFIGKKAITFLGAYSELLGGSILISFGMYIIFT